MKSFFSSLVDEETVGERKGEGEMSGRRELAEWCERVFGGEKGREVYFEMLDYLSEAGTEELNYYAKRAGGWWVAYSTMKRH